jgi:hypothetical protein
VARPSLLLGLEGSDPGRFVAGPAPPPPVASSRCSRTPTPKSAPRPSRPSRKPRSRATNSRSAN